jgi:hypothetical protein
MRATLHLAGLDGMPDELPRARDFRLLLAALPALLFASQAMDWYTSSGFRRALVRFLFALSAHLGT